MSRRGPIEGWCETCGKEVRRWGTRTGWKHVRNWQMNLPPCTDSPPSKIRRNRHSWMER